jgi:hypothetical protein
MGRAALSQAVDLDAPGVGAPIGWLITPNRAFVMFVFVLSLVVPTIISTAACYSVASTDEGPARRFT